MVELTRAMRASVKLFMEMDFASLLHLGEIDLEGLCQLCDPDVEENPLEGDPLRVGSSFTTLGK